MAASPARAGQTEFGLQTCIPFSSGTHPGGGASLAGVVVNSTIREHRWAFAAPPEAGIVARLSKEINVPEAIARVLILRGIDDYDKAKAYFRPSLDLLHDPFLLGDMGKAVDRVVAALERKERVLVFGDYDVDGTNGAAMLYLFFRSLGMDATYYIPDRVKEGYGISRQGIDRAHAEGITLLATDKQSFEVAGRLWEMGLH